MPCVLHLGRSGPLAGRAGRWGIRPSRPTKDLRGCLCSVGSPTKPPPFGTLSRGRVRWLELPPDDRWAEDLQHLRRFAGEATATDPWNWRTRSADQCERPPSTRSFPLSTSSRHRRRPPSRVAVGSRTPHRSSAWVLRPSDRSDGARNGPCGDHDQRARVRRFPRRPRSRVPFSSGRRGHERRVSQPGVVEVDTRVRRLRLSGERGLVEGRDADRDSSRAPPGVPATPAR
jgi:hypothetical protein